MNFEQLSRNPARFEQSKRLKHSTRFPICITLSQHKRCLLFILKIPTMDKKIQNYLAPRYVAYFPQGTSYIAKQSANPSTSS